MAFMICRTDKGTGETVHGPAEGVSYATVLRRIALAEGKDPPTVDDCAAISRRLIRGERIETTFAIYEVRQGE